MTVMFAVSIVLLASTLIISRQTKHLQRMELGFEKDQLMYVSLKGQLKEQAQVLKEEAGRSAGVFSSCLVSHLPTGIGNNGEGWNWEGKDPGFKPLVTNWDTDEDLLRTFGATMSEGNFLGKDRNGIVINRAFAGLIGWDSEIGIRKCMGEQVLSVSGRFIKPFLFSGIIAGIIAIPLTWMTMERWLQNYSSHIDLNIWYFIFSVLTAIGFSVLTVFWQSWKAATCNPVEALRYE